MAEQPTQGRSISQADVDALLASIREEIPGADLCFKTDSRIQRLIGALLRPFNPHYMTAYTTVMFGKIWLPNREFLKDASPEWLYGLLRHERVHLRDMRRFPLFFQLSYVLLLPAGVTFRAYWEWRAYKETLAAELEVSGEISDETIERMVHRFAGPEYLYMWPFKAHFRGVVERECARLRVARKPTG